MAPEIYYCKIAEENGDFECYGKEVDIWAFGVLFYYMLNQSFPFGNPQLIKSSIVAGLSKQSLSFSRNNPKTSVTSRKWKRVLEE